MHAANLLNKRRQHREETERQRHPGVAKKLTNQSLLETSGSNPSLCSAAAGPYPSGRPVTHPPPPAPVQQTSQTNQPNGSTTVTTTPTGAAGVTTPETIRLPLIRDQQFLHHYSDHLNCANFGLCIMIAGVVIMTISGFICYLIGFGEPGVIIGVGGAGFVLIGLIVLSFGNSWYGGREKAKRLPPGFDAESGRGRSLKNTQTNRSGLNPSSGPTSGEEFRGIIPA